MSRRRALLAASALALVLTAAPAVASSAQPTPPAPGGKPGTDLQSLGPAQDILRTLPLVGPLLGGPSKPPATTTTTAPGLVPGLPIGPNSLVAPGLPGVPATSAGPAAAPATPAAPGAPALEAIDTDAMVAEALAQFGPASTSGMTGLGW